VIISTQATLLVRALLDAVPETRAVAVLMTVDRTHTHPQVGERVEGAG